MEIEYSSLFHNIFILIENASAGILMKVNRALKISKVRGEDVLSKLRRNGWLDTNRNIRRHGNSIELPLVDTISQPLLISTLKDMFGDDFEIITQSKPSLKTGIKTPFEEILEGCKAIPDLNKSMMVYLPQKWELLGDVIILKLPKKLKRFWGKIAEVYAKVLNAKAILRRADKVQGVYRKPGVELILGDRTETTHYENKVKFRFDPIKIMFSSGNIDERIRIATLANKNDTVVDMFAGIGYFCLPIAIHSRPKKVIACELNPTAFHYLCENIKLNQVEDIIQPILGDNRDTIPAQSADRIVMGYIKSDKTHIAAAFRILKPTGGFIHFHDVGFKKDAIRNAFLKIQDSLTKLGLDSQFEVVQKNHYMIKSYGPKLVHLVLDIELKSVDKKSH